MAESGDDEDLKKAIALSLQDGTSVSPSHIGSRRSAVVDLTSEASTTEDEEDDIPQSIAASRLASRSASKDKAPAARVEVSTTTSSVSGQSLGALAGLDRAQMERERLARLKRKASISPPPSRKEARLKPETIQDIESVPTRGRRDLDLDTSAPAPAPSTTSHENVKTNGSSGHRSPKPNVAPGIQYPFGTVRKTWAFGHSRDQDVKFEEVLQRQDLNIAVLSSFQWDVEWLVNKIDMSKTKLMLVMQAKDEPTKDRYRAETSGLSNLRLCFPPMEGNVNCMHSKLQLLFHQTYLRIVVPTANLVPYDWGENGSFMENTAFIIDLPRLAESQQGSETRSENLTSFAKELIYFLEASKIPQDVVSGILKFDFSATSKLAFVHSIGGPHGGEAWRRTGYCGLGAAVRRLDLAWSGPLNIDFVASSIGSLNDDLIKALYLAAQGDDGLTEYTWRTSKQPKSRTKDSQSQEFREGLVSKTTLSQWIQQKFRVYFPMQETVLQSKYGPKSAGTICLQSRWFNGPKFPRTLFRDCKSLRSQMLSHNKILFVRPQTSPDVSDPPPPAWAYVGSANLSESAWGRLVLDKTTKKPKLTCRNWECGVIIVTPSTPSPPTEKASGASADSTGMDVFNGAVPVPFQLPGEEYGSRPPWYYSEQGS